MTRSRIISLSLALLSLPLVLSAGVAPAAQRSQSFDSDPGWEGFDNRLMPAKPPMITQDFGFSDTNHAGQSAGEMGGGVRRAAEPAYYAERIPSRTLNDKLTASGSFALTKTTGGSGIFFGFFNGNQRGATGRPIGSLGMDFDGENSGARLALRLITAHNQSCGTFITPFVPGKFRPTPIRNDGTRYTWKLEYDPQGAGGRGRITFSLHDDSPKPGELDTAGMPERFKQEAQRRFPDVNSFSVDLPEGFKQQGTSFDHFGLMNTMKPGGTMDIYFDDLECCGQSQDFTHDPKWDASGNRSSYQASEIAGAQDFGFSRTSFAGGKPGEIGGTIWRSEKPAFYADRVGPLSLDDALSAHGRIAFVAGAPDSGVLLGWFNADALKSSRELKDFVGIHLEGPTRVGHYFAAECADADGVAARVSDAPVLVPDGTPHTWSIRYKPDDNEVIVTLDTRRQTLHLKPVQRKNGAKLDHFGIFAPRVGGSQVKVYLDDLTYTAGPGRG